MKNKKITASILSTSMLVAPIVSQAVVVYAQENSENATSIPYNGNKDCVTGEEVTTGLSLMIQNQGGGDYKNCGVKVYKISDDDVISGTKQNSMVNNVSVDEYDLSQAKLVSTFHTICFDDKIWTNDDGSITEKDGDVGIITGKPTFKALDSGNYILVYDGEMAGFAAGIGLDFGGIFGNQTSKETYQRVAFNVVENQCTSLDLEESTKIKTPEIEAEESGSVELKAVIVETDENGNVIKNEDGSYKLTNEVVKGVIATPETNENYLTQEDIDVLVANMGGLMSEKDIVKMAEKMGYIDIRGLDLVTNENGVAIASNISPKSVNMKVTIPDGYKMVEEKEDSTFTYTIVSGEKTTKVIELYVVSDTDEDVPITPTEITQGIRVLVKDRYTKEMVKDATFTVIAKDNKDFSFNGTSTLEGVTKVGINADTYTASLVTVPEGYELNTEKVEVVLEKATKENQITDLILYVDKGVKEEGALITLVRDKYTKDPIPGATVEVIDKDGNVIITTQTDSNGNVSKDKLPAGDYTVKVTKVPDGYNIPEDQKATVKVNETTSIIFELEKAIGALDVLVRDKDTKDPIPGAKVEVIDKDGNVIVTTQTDSNGKVLNDKLPEGDYTIKVIEVPDGYNIPEDQKVTIKVNETTSIIFELEKAIGALDVLVRDKDTKKVVPNATVEVIDKDGKVIITTQTDTNGKVSKDKLPAGDYTVKVIEVPDGYKLPEDQKATVKNSQTTILIFELEKAIGDLEVVVRDKDTKDPIPNAKVEVLDKDGNVIVTTTTNNEGKVSKDKLPVGDYTIRVTEVPDGYNTPEDQKATVKESTKTTVIFELEKNTGDLEVVVRDKDTKDPIPNAKVEVIDKDGNIIITTQTDSNGNVSKDKLPVGDYTIKVTEVPDGYNTPEDQKATIKESTKTTVIFELEKENKDNNVVQTGDNTKILAIVGTLTTALGGMFVSLKKRK